MIDCSEVAARCSTVSVGESTFCFALQLMKVVIPFLIGFTLAYFAIRRMRK